VKPKKAAIFFRQRAKRSFRNALLSGKTEPPEKFLPESRSFCPCGNLVGECLPQTLLMRLAPLKNPSKYFSDFSKTVPLHTLFFSY